MTSNGAKLLNYKKPLMNGIFAVFKEKGDTIQDYKNWIKLTLYHESRVEFGFHCGKEIVDLSPRYVEPFATGVVCVGFGAINTRLIALTRYWNHEWFVSGKLGIETRSYYYDSQVVYQMPFNHINEDMFVNSFKSLIGSKEQLIPPSIQTDESFKENDPLLEGTQPKKPPIARIRTCHDIELVSFDPPLFKLKIISDGLFSCRSLVHDLGLKLDCCAHVTDLHLEKMGPLGCGDCLKKHEIHLNNIYKAIEKYTLNCKKDLKRFKHLSKSPRFI